MSLFIYSYKGVFSFIYMSKDTILKKHIEFKKTSVNSKEKLQDTEKDTNNLLLKVAYLNFETFKVNKHLIFKGKNL